MGMHEAQTEKGAPSRGTSPRSLPTSTLAQYDAHLKAKSSQFVLRYPHLDHRRMIRESEFSRGELIKALVLI